jgi:hypothetical protein
MSVAGANAETFLALGLKDREIFIHLMEGMRLPTRIRFEGHGDQMIATPEPDYKTRLLYMQEILKLTGKYPAEQVESKSLNILVNPEDVKGKSAAAVTDAYLRSTGGL